MESSDGVEGRGAALHFWESKLESIDFQVLCQLCREREMEGRCEFDKHGTFKSVDSMYDYLRVCKVVLLFCGTEINRLRLWSSFYLFVLMYMRDYI